MVDIGNRLFSGSVIDTDLHNTVPSIRALFPYLPAYWRERVNTSAFKGPQFEVYPAGLPTSARPEARPTDGRPAGSDLGLLREQALDVWRVEYGILNCAYAVDTIRNPDAASAVAAAVNDWQIAEWLDKEPRLRGSLVVPSQNPELAAAEIARCGDHPSFVQVFLPARSGAPYGRREYHPLMAAAVEHDLAVSIQFGGSSGNPPTPVGWPSYHIEEYVGMASTMQSQVMSLVAEGAFDRFPELRVAVVEGGFTWLPSLMWRLDKEWKGLRREVPWVRRAPSEYIREHVRFTIQPVDVPSGETGMLSELLADMWGEDLLMFSTDYPHWHFDAPQEAFPVQLGDDGLRKVLSENARSFYKLN